MRELIWRKVKGQTHIGYVDIVTNTHNFPLWENRIYATSKTNMFSALWAILSAQYNLIFFFSTNPLIGPDLESSVQARLWFGLCCQINSQASSREEREESTLRGSWWPPSSYWLLADLTCNEKGAPHTNKGRRQEQLQGLLIVSFGLIHGEEVKHVLAWLIYYFTSHGCVMKSL